MKKKIFNILKYLAFTALGVFLFWMVYRDQDFSQIWHTLVNDVNYFWVIISLLFGLLSHVSRTLRWKIALEPLGENPKTINAFITVMVSYFMNLLLPRMGEFVRCGMLSKYEKIPFSKLFGTVVTERIIDMLMLLLMLLLVMVLQFDKILHFGRQNPQVMENIQAILHSPILWIAVFVLIAALLVYIKINKKRGGKNKLLTFIEDFAAGIKSVFSMRRYKAYIAHTFFIWFMYFMMLYMIFFSLDFTSNLGPLAALLTFVMASFGMVAPVQGGIGAWHFMAEKALGLYGIESVDGKLFALLAHSSMNVMILFLGAVCIILIPIVNRNYHPKVNQQQ
ncbi:lysylphosphatidylglycerol synthase transmembrane domain-containing protein [Roseimarinus sediminis]|uniref:lysylphosphatidylglycerol synthase transmembrane domain-containing protein n=1 Tax=Roseimarinus sediminis TaxID=1610899 RepID=UPI003D1BACE7